MPVMVFSIDENTNKDVVYAGVLEKFELRKRLEVSEWLKKGLGPLKGKCGRGKGGSSTVHVGAYSHALCDAGGKRLVIDKKDLLIQIYWSCLRSGSSNSSRRSIRSY
ncbi:hypothetical protein GOBAR_AA05767 [Gossypium barbadense]|uniref:Uncharacterized protein n=1 Tax=Gossypium barbadense TaxID=3634 RepID=A0A2P5YGX8_GOSBA|nr:hypothetical protein GOBAR_AA05767 [Gossypium barbadense]